MAEDVPAAAGGRLGSKLADFEIEGRTGRRRMEPGYYGCNSTVWDVHPRGRAEVKLALKVVFNVEEVQTVDIEEHFHSDFSFLEDCKRLPPHPNILRVLAHFTDCASQATLGPSWDADPEFVRERSLCVLMERMDGSLKQLLTDRRQAADGPPYFTAQEFFSIATQLSSAVAHLHTHGVVHRDFKPDNLLVRRVSEGAVLEVRVADFGEALDAYEFCEPSAPPTFSTTTAAVARQSTRSAATR